MNPLEIERRGPVAWLWMNRPAQHNAFDERLIAELTEALRALQHEAPIRVLVLAGRGKSFSAGADLAWMQRQGAASAADNLADARRLGDLFTTLAGSAKPTLARVHGAALGGGMGLAAAGHICVASDAASFATSEVRFGIVPAVISPYVLRAIGERQATRYFQTAERIPAARAQALGLVHEVVAPDNLDTCVQTLVDALLAGGPLAQTAALRLVRDVAQQPLDAAVVEHTAQVIAALRATPEAREGLNAFLAKRTPLWTQHCHDV